MEEKKEIKISLGTGVFLVVVILILGALLAIKIMNGNSNNDVNNQKTLSIEETIDILNKSKNTINYKCSYVLSDGSSKKYDVKVKYKDGIEIDEIKDEKGTRIKQYINYADKEMYIIAEDEKIVLKRSTVLSEENILKKNTTETIDFLKIISEQEYSYIGEEEYNNKKCEVIEINHKYEVTDQWIFYDINVNDGIIVKYKIWIDKESGVIINKEIEYNGTTIKTEYNYEFNCVTDEEVKLPDLTGYEVIEQ